MIKNRNETRHVVDIEPGTLDQYVGSFILDIRKADGSEYEPDSLTSFHRSINRKLEEFGYPYSLVDSKEFKLSKKVLESKRRELKQKGMGNRKNVAQVIDEDMEEKLWETKQLGDETAQSLQNTVWYFNAKLLGFRGVQESRQLQWGDLQLKNRDGEEYIEFNERETKTRHGNSTHLRPFAPKIFPNHSNPSRCPIVWYKKFRDHRPSSMLSDDSPFYLGVVYRLSPTHPNVWYRAQPLGHDKLSSIVKNMSQNAKIDGKFTNHSVRRTMISNLLHSGVHPNLVAQLSGHKSVQSLQNYHTASLDQQKGMCNILTGASSSMSKSIENRPHCLPISEAPPATTAPALPASVTASRSCVNNAVTNTETVLQTHSNDTRIGLFSQNRNHNSLSGLFAGAVFNGPVHITFN